MRITILYLLIHSFTYSHFCIVAQSITFYPISTRVCVLKRNFEPIRRGRVGAGKFERSDEPNSPLFEALRAHLLGESSFLDQATRLPDLMVRGQRRAALEATEFQRNYFDAR